MTVEIRYSVMTPEAGVQKTTGGPPPMMQAQPGIYMPPPGLGGPRPGTGGPQRSMAAASSFALAKRLDTLEGKTVYLVDTGFGGSYKFMQQLQKWFGENMPSVKTIRKRKTGHVFMDDTTDLWEEIKAKGHAAVLGVAGWPGCVTAVAGGSRTLERAYGIPVAPVSTHQFLNLVKDNLRINKSPLPFVFTPHPVIGMPPEALYGYLDGNDPETGKRVIEEIIDALTKPVAQTKLPPSPEAGAIGAVPALLTPDTEDNLQRLFYQNGWTDGLPIILPTEERVRDMLAGTSRPADEVVGEVFQMDTRETVKYTVLNVAVVAVMAGARPEHFPVILAIASTRQTALMPSTTAFGAMLLVNGPIRKEIGMNCGIGAFSAVNQANSVIGRAWLLMSICWGYNRPMKTLWSSQGSNLTYNSMCCGENEERSVWEPFHVQKGFKSNESVVSIFRGWTLFSSPGTAANRSLGEELKIELGVMPPTNSAATIIVDPLVARNLKENQGFATPQDFARWLSQNVKMPAGRYWGTDHIDMLVASQAYQGIEPYASWKKVPDDQLIAPFYDPSQINIVVVGGETSPLWKASDYRHNVSASIDRWRPNKSSDECADGTCGIPDPDDPAQYK